MRTGDDAAMSDHEVPRRRTLTRLPKPVKGAESVMTNEGVGPMIAVAHDYCTQTGGAERVALSLLGCFEQSTLVTAIIDTERTFRGFNNYTVSVSNLQRIGAFRRDPRLAFPLLAPAWSSLRAEGARAVVCSSSGWSHGIRTSREVPKVVYCHNPARWLYQPDDYFRDFSPSAAKMLGLANPALKLWDRRAADSADVYLANSSVVAARVRQAYGISARVIHPPSGLDAAGPREPVAGVEPGYLLTVGRGRGYKNTDVVARAVSRYGKLRLVVVGGYDGVERLPHVTRVTGASDDQMRWLYANALAVVSLSHEDFGLTPVEGFGFGTPAVLLRRGGFLDSMIEGVTGVFADAVSEESLIEALERLPGSCDEKAILGHAQTFSPRAFREAIRGVVDALL